MTDFAGTPTVPEAAKLTEERWHALARGAQAYRDQIELNPFYYHEFDCPPRMSHGARTLAVLVLEGLNRGCVIAHSPGRSSRLKCPKD